MNMGQIVAKLREEAWNRCDVCGKFIALSDFLPEGGATRKLVLPESDQTYETWETLCRKHAESGQ